MRRLDRAAVIALGFLLAPMSHALAQVDLTGLYAGTGDAAGITMRLFSNGEVLAGDFSGRHAGTIEGKSDGDGAAAFIADDDPDTFDETFSLKWQDDAFELVILDGDLKPRQLSFNRMPSGSAGTPAPPGLFFVIGGERVGPLSPEEIMTRVAAGEIDRDTLAWSPGDRDWVTADLKRVIAPVLPPSAPRIMQYFVVENGAQAGPFNDAEMLDRIRAGLTKRGDLTWHEGLIDWEPIETIEQHFARALAPAIPAPPLPPAPGADSELESILRRMIADGFAGSTAEQQADVFSCIMGVLEGLTDTERGFIVSGNGILTTEQTDQIEAAHPGFNDSTEACVAPLTGAAPSETVTPLVPEPPATPVPPPLPSGASAPAVIGAEDALSSVVREYLATQPSLGEAAGTIHDCLMKALIVVSPADRQMLIDTKFHPSDEQGEGLVARYPSVQNSLQRCFPT